MKDISQQDVTVMRTDTSVSNSWSTGSSSGEADPPRVLKQRFVLDEKLGSGGMGTVFRAKDLRKVEARDRQPFLAVKVLNNDFREHPEAFIALQREAAKSQTLSHSNIVSIFDFDKDGDVPFITMELLEGQELAQLLRAYPGGLPEQMAWEIIEGMCGGLRHAHEAGIVHADFKPGNVFISPQNAPKLLDFGIARAVHLTEAEGEDTLFDPARLAALTPAYASREMLNGDTPETRDDLYSLGIVIYLILTGHHPYGRLSADEAARDDLKPEKPRQLSRRQWRVLRACLQFNRPERPADVAEVQKFLLEPSPWRSRISLVAALAVAVAFALNYYIQDADLSEVKQEVRQTTLLDSQVARIAQLLDKPAMNLAWEQSLRQELVVLRQLEGSQAAADRLLRQTREIYR
ncbi:MAG: serine/threonine-protein kinase, partial [Pseudomonadales bacterium]